MTADAPPVTFSRAGVLRGMRASVPVAISVATYGVVFGVLARQVGVTFVEALVMNVVVFAGAAQTAALDIWVYPLPVAAIVVTVLLINLRLIMLGASLRPWMHHLPGRIVYPTLHVLSDEAWAVAMGRYRRGDRDAGIVLGCNLAIFLAWVPSVAAGHLLGGRIGDPAAIGLDFAFTAVFAAMLFGGYRGRFDLVPWGVSGMVAWLAWWLLPGTWYVILGGLAGFGVAMLRAGLPPREAPLREREPA